MDEPGRSKFKNNSVDFGLAPAMSLHTVAPRYNAVVGVHEMEPRCKRGAL